MPGANSLMRRKSKEDAEKGMNILDVVLHYVKKKYLLEKKMARNKPRNRSLRHMYNLRSY